MGFGSFLSSAASLGSKLVKSPVGRVAGLVPGLGTVVNAVGLGASAYGVYKALSPSKPTGIAGPMPGGLPALPGMSGVRGSAPIMAPGNTGSFGIPRGPGGKMQLPWNDPSTPAFLKQFALDDSAIKICYRAPRGYVIVHDSSGRPFPLLKKIAQQYHLWKPAKKPPISVRDWSALKRADRTIHKMKKIVTMTTRIEHHVGKGGKVHFTKHKAHKA